MLGVRLDAETERGLEALARQSRRSKSEIVRDLVSRHVRQHDEALKAEARRQSLRARERDNPEDWAFWESVSTWNDTRE